MQMAEKKLRKKHKKKNYILRFAIVLGVCLVIAGVTHLPYFNVEGIAVLGNQEITDEEVIKLSGIETGKSIFDVHPLIVKHKVKENLYIDTVKVHRKLPKNVEITISEKTAVAQIKQDDKYIVIDVDGTVIESTSEKRKATTIGNITVKSAKRTEPVQVKEKETLEKSLQLITTADENDLFFKTVYINKGKVNAYIFDSLMVKGKYRNLINCIESGTLKSVVYDLYQKDEEKGTIIVSKNNYCFFTPKK